MHVDAEFIGPSEVYYFVNDKLPESSQEKRLFYCIYGAPRLVSLGLFSSAGPKQPITRSNSKRRAWKKKAGNRESRGTEVRLLENWPVLANAKSFTMPPLSQPGTNVFVDFS